MQRRPLLAASLGLALTIGAFSAAPASAGHLTPVQVLLPGNRIVTVTTGAPSEATSDVVVSCPPGCPPSRTSGFRLERAA